MVPNHMDSMDQENVAKGITWVLDDLYCGEDDPKLDQDIHKARDKALKFVSSYKGGITEKNLDAPKLLTAIKKYEAIYDLGMGLYLYAYLRRSSDTRDPERIKFFHRVMERWTEISNMITFFRLELIAFPEDFINELANHQDLSEYRYFLFHLIKWRPHTLGEPEERIINTKNLSGKDAFISLYDELMGSLSFSVVTQDAYGPFTTNQVMAILHSPDRSLREKACRAFFQELAAHGKIFTHIINTMTLDHHLENLERGYSYPMQRMHMQNGVDDSVIEKMMETVEDHYTLARRYFSLKAGLLGIKRLKTTDLMAPLKKEALHVDFPRARQLLLEAMGEFHPLFHSIVQEIFKKRWIDAEARKTKQYGAFCKCFSPAQQPYVSISYTGSLHDLMTLTHEMGHGMHYKLASKQSYLNFNPPNVLAETAATFSEIILAEHLMIDEEFHEHLPGILASKIEGFITTIFRQNVLTRFEQAIHRSRMNHPLSTEEICRIWLDENHRLYGKDVEMMSDYRWGWAYIPHIIHRPFYCYSYIFGNLLSIILFQNYEERGAGFLDEITHLFSSGASEAPLDMLSDLGFNPRDKSFWRQAFSYINRLIDALAVDL